MQPSLTRYHEGQHLYICDCPNNEAKSIDTYMLFELLVKIQEVYTDSGPVHDRQKLHERSLLHSIQRAMAMRLLP